MLQKRNFTFVKSSQMSILKIKFDFQPNDTKKCRFVSIFASSSINILRFLRIFSWETEKHIEIAIFFEKLKKMTQKFDRKKTHFFLPY